MKPRHQQNKRRSYLIFTILFFAFYASTIAKVLAQGDLLVLPKRLVFDENSKAQDINLANIGNDTATYEVSFIQYRMTSNGDFVKITEPDSGQYFASPYLRVFPRSVTLAPNESQLIKVQVLRATVLNDGEYRSHLYFRQVQSKKPLGEEVHPAAEDTNSISVRLKPVYGISIPCFIRKGESHTTVSIANLECEHINDSIFFAKIVLIRTGNMSVYGDISVYYSDGDKMSAEVGQIQGVSVYTPGQDRKCKLQLKKPSGVDYSKGKLKVVYYTLKGKKQIILAEAEIALHK